MFNPLAILDTLLRQEVRFIVIGGIAATLHGSTMITSDLDVCYERSKPNFVALAAALRELDATLRGVPDDVPFVLDARTLEAGDHFTFDTRYGPFDCLGTPAGSGGYAALDINAVAIEWDGSVVRLASLDDLMAMKRAAGRPKDRAALEILGAVRDEVEGR